jgi:glutathionyl-hydroquinone reductase
MAKKPAENQVGYKHLEKGDGKFNRQISSFRSWISSEPGAEFPPEKDRYVSSQHDPAAWGGVRFIVLIFGRFSTSISAARGRREQISLGR